jgi:hypothetical protein
MNRFETGRLRIELSENTVARLLAGGQLCAADLNCLDNRSKQRVLEIILNTCRSFRPLGRALPENRLE